MALFITRVFLLGVALTSTVAAELVLLDMPSLQRQRDAYQAAAPTVVAAVDALRSSAEAALVVGPFSVTFKEETPPSGDKCDYMSQGPYWWPNPDTDDGLPYIRRDGERNPESDQLDRRPMGQMASAVTTLALAYYYTEDERYAEHAAHLLRTWFLAPATGMNPHLRYGQRIPGRTLGRGIGIIDTRCLMPIGDAAIMLRTSESWSPADHAALQDWFAAYLTWLLESDLGRSEAREHNNHGTWYDAQVAAFALFAGDAARARRIIADSAPERLAAHVAPDGAQPHELSRTLPAHYSIYNLWGFVDLATMGEKVGVDLWRHATEDGRGVRRALDFLLAYAVDEEPWPYQDISTPNWSGLDSLLRRAAIAYEHPEYETARQRLLGDEAARSRVNLLYPLPEAFTAP